jgi:hypothetical protein
VKAFKPMPPAEMKRLSGRLSQLIKRRSTVSSALTWTHKILRKKRIYP